MFLLWPVVLFLGIFVALYNVVIDAEGFSILDSSVDAVRTKIIDYLERGDNRRKLDVLGLSPGRFIKAGFMFGFFAGCLGFVLLVGFIGPVALVFIFVGVSAGVFLADLALNQAYRKWQEGIQEGIPLLVDFLPAFLDVKGVTIRDALENTVSFLSEPLKSEMGNAVAEIKRNGNAQEVFSRLKARSDNPVVGAICTRLAMSWETTVTTEIFLDLRQEIEQSREEAAARVTTAMKMKGLGGVFIGLIGLAFLAGYPGFLLAIKMMSHAFGGE